MAAAEDQIRIELLKQLRHPLVVTSTASAEPPGVYFSPAPTMPTLPPIEFETFGSKALATAADLRHWILVGTVNVPATTLTFRMPRSAVAVVGANSPFDELRYTKQRAVREMIEQVPAANRAAVTPRLAELVGLAAEEYPDTETPSPQSLQAALQFFTERIDVMRPMLSLASTGNVWAEWRVAERRAVIEFLGNGSMNVATLYPDEQEYWRQTSFAANWSWPQVTSQMRPGGLLEWLVR